MHRLRQVQSFLKVFDHVIMFVKCTSIVHPKKGKGLVQVWILAHRQCPNKYTQTKDGGSLEFCSYTYFDNKQ